MRKDDNKRRPYNQYIQPSLVNHRRQITMSQYILTIG